MSGEETAYQSRIMLALSSPTIQIERRNVGTVKMARGGFFHAGSKKGATDLAGVAGPGGWALYIECKVQGRTRTAEQFAYAEAVSGRGAIYMLADEAERSVDAVARDLECILAERRAGDNRGPQTLREIARHLAAKPSATRPRRRRAAR